MLERIGALGQRHRVVHFRVLSDRFRSCTNLSNRTPQPLACTQILHHHCNRTRLLRPFITQSMKRSSSMARHFGVLIPSTNTTVEIRCRLLPATYRGDIGRLNTSPPGRAFSPSRGEDIDYQSRLLGTAKVELVILAQTSAS